MKDDLHSLKQLPLDQVVEILSVSKRHIYRLIEGGELACVKIARLTRIPEVELRAYLARNTVKNKGLK